MNAQIKAANAAGTWPAIVTVGESMAMFTALQAGPLAACRQFERHLAGAESNVAVGLARLGHRVSWISCLGRDSLGDFVISELTTNGVQCDHVRIDDTRSTGFMLKSKAEHGEDPQTEYHRRNSAASAMGRSDWPEAAAPQWGHVHATGVFPALSATTRELAEHAIGEMRKSGGSISFDPNLRPRLWPEAKTMVATINALAFQADWVLPGLKEGEILTGFQDPGEIADFYLRRGVRAVVVKLGAQGAFLKADGIELHVPAFPVAHVVDTVGAGDGFAAGLISARLEGLSWECAVARGNWVGAQAIQSSGDMDGLPLRAGLPSDCGTSEAG